MLDLYGQNFYFGSEDYLFASVLNVVPFLCVFFINGGQRNEGFRILSHEFKKYEMGVKNKFQLVIYTTTMVRVIYAVCSFLINYTFLIYSFVIVIFAKVEPTRTVEHNKRRLFAWDVGYLSSSHSSFGFL